MGEKKEKEKENAESCRSVGTYPETLLIAPTLTHLVGRAAVAGKLTHGSAALIAAEDVADALLASGRGVGGVVDELVDVVEQGAPFRGIAVVAGLLLGKPTGGEGAEHQGGELHFGE